MKQDLKQYQTGHKAKQDFTRVSLTRRVFGLVLPGNHRTQGHVNNSTIAGQLAEPCALQVGQRSTSLRLVEPTVGQSVLGRRPFPFIAVQHGLDQRASLHRHGIGIEIASIFSRKNECYRMLQNARVFQSGLRFPHLNTFEHHANHNAECKRPAARG